MNSLPDNSVQADQPPFEPNTVSAADEETFKHAVNAQNKRELGAAFAHRCLTAVLWLGPAWCCR